MKKGYTHITFVLDSSGSMQLVRDDTIGGFNTFLASQQALPGAATIRLVRFADSQRVLIDFASLNEAKPLTPETYAPDGWTALLDTVGQQIEETGRKLAALPEHDRPEKVIFVILTDGQENHSRITEWIEVPGHRGLDGKPVQREVLKYRTEKLAEMIQRQRDVYNWEFVFLGANQNAWATASSLNIGMGSTMTFAANNIGTRSVFDTASKATTKYRSASYVRGQSLIDDEDLKNQEDAGLKNSTT